MKIIDAHTHIGYWPKLGISKRLLLKAMKKYGVDQCVFSMDASEIENTDPSMSKFKNPSVKMSQVDIAKKALKYCKIHKNKVFMLMWIKPNTEQDLTELEKFYLKNKKYVKGLKVHPYLSNLKMDDKKMIPYLEFARKYHLPVLVHTGVPKICAMEPLINVVKKYPDVTFVAAHLNLGSDHIDAIEDVVKYDNLYCDTAWVDEKSVLRCKERGIINKVMFGTDVPINPKEMYNLPMYQAYLNNTINLTQEEYESFMGGLAKKIYNL